MFYRSRNSSTLRYISLNQKIRRGEYTVHRDIVILANSRRHDGHCIAGKDLFTGAWVRPINVLGRGKVRRDQAAFLEEDFEALNVAKSGPQLMDCVRIGFGEKCGNYCQPENQFIDGKSWVVLPPLPHGRLSEFVDGPSVCFIGKDDQYSAYYPAEAIKANPLKSSLNFVRITHDANRTEIIHTTSFAGKPQYRLRFEYGSQTYNLVITDKEYENSVSQSKNEDLKIIGDCYITIGVGEMYRPQTRQIDLHYRLIVGIIPAYTLR